ncbi:MAG: S8 family serine peptidase [Chitinophagaceae bacterium]
MPPVKKTAPVAGASPVLPPVVFAHASVHSIGGASLFEAGGNITNQNVEGFFSDSFLVQKAIEQLKAAGFRIMGTNGITISIGAPAELYEKAFGTKLFPAELPAIKEFGVEDTATFILPEDGNVRGMINVSKTGFRNVLEGISINEPVYYMNNPYPPRQNYWHLEVPGDVSLGVQADPVHRMGYTGRGIKVMMVDSGWYRHPYFIRRGYRSGPVLLGPAATDPLTDSSGHGTGESANLLAVAPDVSFQMVKMNFADSAGAFNAAVAQNPKVISCSWGSSKQNGPLSAADLVLSAAIANAVARGITVVFSAGNGHWGYPGQHPDVISAGGVFMEANMSLQASNYASGFASNIYPGRNVPDVSGLVGMKPMAAYIMLPVQPGDDIDTQLGAPGAFPNTDQTLPNDGWAAFSGTSAAAPQIAGVCALLKQAVPGLTPQQIKNILKATAVDVTTGNCNPATGGNPALPGPDLATGNGLVNAFGAIKRALASPVPVTPAYYW